MQRTSQTIMNAAVVIADFALIRVVFVQYINTVFVVYIYNICLEARVLCVYRVAIFIVVH